MANQNHNPCEENEKIYGNIKTGSIHPRIIYLVYGLGRSEEFYQRSPDFVEKLPTFITEVLDDDLFRKLSGIIRTYDHQKKQYDWVYNTVIVGKKGLGNELYKLRCSYVQNILYKKHGKPHIDIELIRGREDTIVRSIDALLGVPFSQYYSIQINPAAGALDPYCVEVNNRRVTTCAQDATRLVQICEEIQKITIEVSKIRQREARIVRKLRKHGKPKGYLEYPKD